MTAALDSFKSANIICDQKHMAGKPCDYYSSRSGSLIPPIWGAYCPFEDWLIQQRLQDIRGIFDEFSKALRRKGKSGFQLNHTILESICHIYANDLKPIRIFHNSTGGVDCNRRASILARLVAKHHPVMIEEFISTNDSARFGKGSDLLNINENFALHVFCHFLNLPPKFFRIDVLNKIFSDLRFILKHRDPQIESLVCIARLLSYIRDEKWPSHKPPPIKLLSD